MAEKTFELHEIVRDMASHLELIDGRIVMNEVELRKNRAALMKVTKAEDKKAVLVSLVALASKMMRENAEASSQVIERLIGLAAELIGDVDKARAVFAEAGATHGLARAKGKPKKK